MRRLGEAGALGVLTSLVPPPGPQAWGTTKISTTVSETIPEIGLGCEDYGLVYRLAEHNQGPGSASTPSAEVLGEVPVVERGRRAQGQREARRVRRALGAPRLVGRRVRRDRQRHRHVVMMEAMRILKQCYPNPKRTILVGPLERRGAGT